MKQWERKGVWKRILDAAISRSYYNTDRKLKIKAVSVDSTDIVAKKGQLMGYDGNKKVLGSEIHAAATVNSNNAPHYPY